VEDEQCFSIMALMNNKLRNHFICHLDLCICFFYTIILHVFLLLYPHFDKAIFFLEIVPNSIMICTHVKIES